MDIAYTIGLTILGSSAVQSGQEGEELNLITN
jgi:hypothetical protein